MPNITISIDDDLLKKSRVYAQKHQTSLNALIRRFLKQIADTKKKDWLLECFDLMDKANVNSRGKKWKREDLYDV